jgi:CBS domain-containing protein
MAPRTARDIMTLDPVTAAPDMSVKEAARLMTERSIGCLPVVEGGRLVGLVTERDLIMTDVKVHFPTYIHLLDSFIFYPPATVRFGAELKKAAAASVRDVMTGDPETVTPEATVEDIATLMVDRSVGRLPVMDGDRLVGIVSTSDIVRSIANEE